MNSTATLAILVAVVIIALLVLAAWAFAIAEKARTAGYDEGYEDAARIGQRLGESLEQRLHAAQLRISEMLEEQEAIAQEADRRVAIYAGNSFVSEDIKLLLTAATHLKTAARTYMAFPEANLSEPARAAQAACERLAVLVRRIQEQLEGAEPVLEAPEATA